MKSSAWIPFLAGCLTACPPAEETGLDDPVPQNTAILNREVLGTKACAQDGESIELSAIGGMSGASFDAEAVPGQLRVAWVDLTSEGLELREAELSETGRLTGETFLAEGNGDEAVPGIAEGALAWMNGRDAARRLELLLDGASTLVGEEIPESSQPLVRLESLDDGWVAVWASDEGVHVRWLDGTGLTTRDELIDTGWVSDPDTVASPRGVAISWAVSAEGGSECRLALIDKGGVVLEPTTLSPPGVKCRHPTAVERDGGVLAAWSETGDDHAVTWLAEVLDDGTVTSRTPLAASQAELLRELPALGWLGDDLLLVWSEGTHVEICAGCLPDHELRWVLLDASTLDPLSEVQGASSPNGGGMQRTRVLPTSGGAVLAYDTVFHGYNRAGSAALRCE